MVQMEFNELIGAKKPVFLIAEIGQNHQGNINLAKKMIKIAKEHGADCVKFQKTNLEAKFNKGALQSPYISPNSWGHTYGEHKAHLEFTNEQFLELQHCAKQHDILFSASPMDLESLKFMVELDVPFIKIGSGDANNYMLIEEAASTKVPLIVSTGMQEFSNVKQIYNIISQYHKKFALLHCVSSYPTPVKDVNLRVIELYKREFPDIAIGYSGHEAGTIVSIAAAALGASIIERHITLNKNFKGSDHKSSLYPKEFKTMVDGINTVIVALGKTVKEIKESEMECYRKLRKTIVACRNIPEGSILCMEDLNIKVAQPPGIDGSLIDKLIGKKVNKQIYKDEPLMEDHLIV